VEQEVIIYFRAGGQLRAMLKPDVDYYTRKIEDISVDSALVALIHVDGKMKDLSFKPSNGQIITLQPPVSGG
jgi:molybdopterin converting factor small subunit